MQSVIGALRVNLGLDTAEFQKGSKKAANDLAQMKTRFLAVAGVATAFGTALGAAALKGAAGIDKVAKEARRLEASIGGFRALQMAAEEAGVPLEAITGSVQTMNRELAKGGTGTTAALTALGLVAADLQGLDADKQIALIADQIEAMGLTGGETSAILQGLGIRSKEFILAVSDGGDVIRSARADIDDYGLALSAVDATRIEVANDAIGRLGLIGQYASEQLALRMVPALGQMAQAMTDSLREGGLLRGVIDGLVANLERMTTYIGVAVAAFGGRFVIALVAARVATFSLGGAFVFLKGALLRTGIGILVVGAGELVYQFSKLVSAAGGFGAAMGLLGDVAIETFNRIKSGIDFLVQGFLSLAYNMQASFLSGIRGMAGAFVDFTGTVADGLNSLFGTSLQGASAVITQELGLAENAARGMAGAAQASADAAAAAFSAPSAALAKIRDVAAGANSEIDAVGTTAGAAAGDVEDLADAAGGGSGKLDDMKDSADDLATTMQDRLTSAVDGFAKSFGDFVVNGFSDFKGFADGIVNVFKGAISDMISTAIANPIKLAISGGAAAVAPAVGGAVGGVGSGIAGAGAGAAAGAAGFLGTAWSGLSSGFMTSVYGGLGGTVGAVSGGLAVGGVSGFATAIGALAAPLAAVIAVFSFFKKKTKELDAGLRITADSAGTLVEEFKVIQTKRFWGLSKKTKTELNQAASDLSDPITAAVSAIQANALAMAETIGLGADAFSSFAYNVSLSLKDMDATQAQAAVEAELAKLGDAFANAALGWFEETQGILQAGETWSQALERLANSLTTVNGTMGYLGKALFDISVSGAKAASELIGFFGTLENFNAAQSAYLNAFYSDQERLNLALADMGKTFAALGVEVPASNAAFRALVDAQDLTQSSGRAMYAALIQIAPAFDQVGKATEELATAAATAAAAITAQNAELISQARGNLDRAIAAEGEALKARLDVAQDAFNESKSVVDGLTKALRGLRQEDRLLASRRAAQGVLAGSLAGGRIADSEAFRDALDVVAQPSEGLFNNFEDYQRDFLITANTIAALEKKAGDQLSTDEQMLQSIDLQLEQLEIIADGFSEQIAAIMSVEEAIKALGNLGVFANGTTAPTGSTGGTQLGVVEKAYIDVLGRAGDEAGLKFWNGLLSSGAVPLANFLGEFRKGAVANGEVPRFAAGGLHMGGWRIVGENGPEAEFTPPSRIVSSGQTRSIMGGEIGSMKEEMKAYLREVVRNTGSTARTLDKFDGDGLPAERAA